MCEYTSNDEWIPLENNNNLVLFESLHLHLTYTMSVFVVTACYITLLDKMTSLINTFPMMKKWSTFWALNILQAITLFQQSTYPLIHFRLATTLGELASSTPPHTLPYLFPYFTLYQQLLKKYNLLFNKVIFLKLLWFNRPNFLIVIELQKNNFEDIFIW